MEPNEEQGKEQKSRLRNGSGKIFPEIIQKFNKIYVHFRPHWTLRVRGWEEEKMLHYNNTTPQTGQDIIKETNLVFGGLLDL